MATRFATAGFCILTTIAQSGVALAQAVAPQGDAPVAASPPPACAGVLCSLTPAAMDRPIGADDARRMEAERARQSAEAAPIPSVAKYDRRRHVADGTRHLRTHGRSVAVRSHTPRQRHAEAKTLAATPAVATTPDPRTAAVDAAGPINAIFVLAPRPFDPYGGDYAPWLDRLSWRASPDRADDRTIFTPDGYAEAEPAPVAAPAATQAADDLSRRTDALSQRGFQSLKSDLGRS